MNTLRTVRYRIVLHKQNIPAGSFRFAFFTDLHNACSPEETEQFFTALNRLEPDFVLCGGDSIVAKPGKPVREAAEFMLEVGRRYPLYCGTGNHEYRTRIYPSRYGTMYRDYTEPLRKAGICLLENTSAALSVHGIPVQILGFDMDRAYYQRFQRRILPAGELDQAFGQPDSNAVSILLAHNPLMLDTYLDWEADLTLCGHYHGGVMRFGRHHGLISPDFRLFPDNAYGLFERAGRFCVVSAGCGEHTIPVRIHNPREIVSIEVVVPA